MRKIIHIDMDAFFASVEQRDFPEYKGKPLVVGYAGDRGVIAAASYEARKYGVYSAMSSKVALRKCPHLIFVPARFSVYKEVSETIMNIFYEYTDFVEPLSLDEAFLDVTTNHKGIDVATQIAREIKQKIFDATQLTASAGISYNKFLAKIASDVKKPDGLFVIKPNRAVEFLDSLPIEKFFGVGKVTANRMHYYGIKTGADLKQYSEIQLANMFGKAGTLYYHQVRGIDDREVNADRVSKSVGAETTFHKDMHSYAELLEVLNEVVVDLCGRIEKNDFLGKTLTLKLKYSDFKTISRSKSFSEPLKNYDEIYEIAKQLLFQVDVSFGVRLLGVSLKNSTHSVALDAYQLRINFED